MVLSKNKEHLGITRRKTFPKKTLKPTYWETRNDSSNVSAVLHPDQNLSTTRKFIHHIPTKLSADADKGVYKKCCLSTNTCYCRERPIKPKLMSRPSTCLRLEDVRRNSSDNNEMSRRSLHCLCKIDSTTASQVTTSYSDLMKKYQEDLEKQSGILHFTDQRKAYEHFREDQRDEYLKELEDYESEEEEEKKLKKASRKKAMTESDDESRDESEDETLSTLLGTRQVNSKFGSSGFATEGLNTEELKKFRDEHYFETHAVDFREKDADHTCIHQFKLDDRLLPAPLNVDVYGRSRCSICYKPMEGDKVQLSKSYFSENPSRTSLKKFSKCYELGLMPRTISIGGKKSKIELKLSEKDVNQFGRFIGKYKRPQYTNTFALRQQKMTL